MMCQKPKELEWKENNLIQTCGTEDTESIICYKPTADS